MAISTADRAASAEVATALKPVLLRRKLTTAQARLTR